MEPGTRGESEQPTLLKQGHCRALRLHEVLQSHEADLLRHAESALPVIEPDTTVLREGADRIHRAADAAARLLDSLTRALRDEEAI